MPFVVAADDVLTLIDGREYSFQIKEDGGVILLAYDFSDRKILTGAYLALYRRVAGAEIGDEELPPTDLDAQESVDGSVDGEDVLEEKESDDEAGWQFAGDFRPSGERTLWLRIDYDLEADPRGVIHHDCHLHISGFPDARIPLTGVPSPRQFIEFVFMACYPHLYREHCLDEKLRPIDSARAEKVNEAPWAVQSAHIVSALIHLSVPGCDAQ